MVLQDKYKRANSSRYRATHGGIQSNRQKAAKERANEIPDLNQAAITTTTTTTTIMNSNNPSSSNSSSSADLTSTNTESSSLNHQTTSNPSTTTTTTMTTTTNPFSRRVLKSNADRYLEPDPDPNEEPEPEVDLSEFLEKQKSRLNQTKGEGRLEDGRRQEEGLGVGEKEDDDIDESFDHLFQHSKHGHHHSLDRSNLKSKLVYIEDPNSLGLDELDNERKKADAARELIARFSGLQTNVSSTTTTTTTTLNSQPNPNRKLLNRKTTKTLENFSDRQPQQQLASHRLKPACAELVGPLEDEEFLDEVLNDSSGTYGRHKRRT